MVEEKLHGGKTMWYMGEGEQNETQASISCGVCLWSAEHGSFSHITAMLGCTGDTFPSFGLC